MPDELRLRVGGCGHNVDIVVAASATLADVKAAVQQATGLAPAHQKLVMRGRNLEDDSSTVGAAGIEDRTKLMLLHSAAYAADAKGAAAITAIAAEIDGILARAELSPAAREEMLTQACCKLDTVEVGDSATLRELRRAQLKRAQGGGA